MYTCVYHRDMNVKYNNKTYFGFMYMYLLVLLGLLLD